MNFKMQLQSSNIKLQPMKLRKNEKNERRWLETRRRNTKQSRTTRSSQTKCLILLQNTWSGKMRSRDLRIDPLKALQIWLSSMKKRSRLNRSLFWKVIEAYRKKDRWTSFHQNLLVRDLQDEKNDQLKENSNHLLLRQISFSNDLNLKKEPWASITNTSWSLQNEALIINQFLMKLD